MNDRTKRETDRGETAPAGRPARFRDHLIPRSRPGRVLAVLFVALFLLAEWPMLTVANRVEPTLLGFPFLFVWLFVVYTALIVVLVTAAWLEL